MSGSLAGHLCCSTMFISKLPIYLNFVLVVCSGFSTGFFFPPENNCLLKLKTRLIRAVRINQNIKVADLKTKTMNSKKLNCSVELKGTAESAESVCY